MNLFEISILWLAYFALHSMLASISFKNKVASWWPRIIPAYRLLYNLSALLLLLPLLWLQHQIESPLLWQWQGVTALLTNGLAILAIIGFLISLKAYDGMTFIGLKQWQQHQHSINDQDQFRPSFSHRFVRHPWYFYTLVILWTRDMSLAQFTFYSLVTFYFFIGVRFEEKKLQHYFGDQYTRYQQLVPALIPRPWRYLNAQQAVDLLNPKNLDQELKG